MRSTAPVTLAMVAALCLTGCGDPDDTAADDASPQDSTTTTTPATTTTAGLTGDELKACETEGRTIETALSAHLAATGELPATLADLAPDWLKEPPSEQWTVTVDGDDFTLNGPCPIPERPSVTTASGADPLPE